MTTVCYDFLQLLMAPTPFLIGVPSSFFTFKGIATVPNDVVVADLDRNIVEMPSDFKIPDIPEPEFTILTVCILWIMTTVERSQKIL